LEGSAAATSGDDVVAFVAWGPLWVVLGVDLGCLGAMLVVLLLPDLLLLCKLSLSSGASTATSAEGLEEFSWSFVVVASSPSSEYSLSSLCAFPSSSAILRAPDVHFNSNKGMLCCCEHKIKLKIELPIVLINCIFISALITRRALSKQH